MPAEDKNISRIIQHAFTPQVQFGEVIYPKGAVFGPRSQQQFQMVLLLRGEARIQIDDEVILVSAGEVILLRPRHREFFTFAKQSETHHSWCAIDPGLISRPLAREVKADAGSMPISSAMEQLISLGLRSRGEKEDASWLVHLALSAFCLFIREEQTSGPHPVLPEALWKARELIEKRFAEPLTVSAIALSCGLSANHLIKLFRRHLGETPASYLWRWRIDHGVRLLRETGLTISEIAFRTGFQNPFHFSRLVRKRYRLPPRELRREWWKKSE